MQEARLALWDRARNAESLEEAEKYFMHVYRALFEHVRRMAALNIPAKKFIACIRTVYILSWDGCEHDEPDRGFEDGLIGSLDCQRFIDSLEPLEKDVLVLKMEGMSQKQIAALLTHGSESRISRIMRRIREKYEIFRREPFRAS